MNAQFVQYMQWVAFGCIGIVAFMLAAAALLQSRPRRVRSWVLICVALLDAVVAFLLVGMTNIALSAGWMAVLGGAGLVVGWFTGRMTKTVVKDGHVYAKLSPVAPWAIALAYTGAVAALFFGTVALFSAMGLLVVFAAALMLSQAVSATLVIQSAKAVRPAAQPTEAYTGPRAV
jgi:hypothetical protein